MILSRLCFSQRRVSQAPIFVFLHFFVPDLVISIGLFIFAPASSFEALFLVFSLPFFGLKRMQIYIHEHDILGFKIFCYVSCRRVLQGAVGGLRLSFFEV